MEANRYLVQHFDPRNTHTPEGGSAPFPDVREGFESPLGERVIVAIMCEVLIPETIIDLRVEEALDW